MKRIKSFLKETIKNIWFGFKTSFLASKKYFSLKCLVLLSTTFIPLMTIWLWKVILNGITDIENSKDTVILCLVIYLLLKLLSYLIDCLNEYVNSRYMDELTFYIEGVMIEKTSRMDLAFLIPPRWEIRYAIREVISK